MRGYKCLVAVVASLCALSAAGVAYGSVAGESRSAKNSVFVEGLGAGLVYSVNYERMVLDDLGVRAGFGYMRFGSSASAGAASADSSSDLVFFPITASYVGIGSGSHALELGAGATLTYISGSTSTMGLHASGSGVTGQGTLIVGYRYQPRQGGFQFRAGLMGIYGPGMSLSTGAGYDPGAWGILPWAHLSLGGTF